MQLIRALHVKQYDSTKGRFTSNCFKNYKGGISVFEEVCARGKSTTVCKHIPTFYSNFDGNPVIFCKISLETLKEFGGCENLELINTPSDSGDDCHRDILNVSDKVCRKFFKNYFSGHIHACCKEGEVLLSSEQITNLVEFIEECKR